jgi:DNA-binding NtrC family response regulator/tetratricopeptide (TPR) repeat protein
MQWIADRFFNDGQGWVDAATGHLVRLHVTAAGPAGADIEWSDWCSRLARIRHPRLNPLLDFGAASRVQRFEAYDASRPPLSERGSIRPDDHGRACLEATLLTQGISLDEPRQAIAVRRPSGVVTGERAVGIQLQPRAVLDAIDEALDRARPVGPVALQVTAPRDSGMRTTMMLVARAARVRGFVAVSMRLLARDPALVDALVERHLCVLHDDPVPRAAVALFLARISRASTRRHVIIRFSRGAPDVRSGLMLERMSDAALVAMVVAIDREPPDPKELKAAARLVDGRPGAFVAALSAAYARTRERALTVHELPARYDVPAVGPAPVADPPLIAGRILGAALRAVDRASNLERSGRHEAAARVLERGRRVLEGRQRHADAAECAFRRGVLALDRGQTDMAVAMLSQAADLAPGTATAVRSAVALGVALTDAARLVEAEAILRGALTAAELDPQRTGAVAAAAALGRCLYWQQRPSDAIAVLSSYRGESDQPQDAARVFGVLSRCEAQLGRMSTAVAAARDGQRLAARASDHRVLASLELAVATALGRAGDRPGAHAALARAARIARVTHLPLFRIRATLLSVEAREKGWQRRIALLVRARLPALLAQRVAAAASAPPMVMEPVSELERLLDVSQRSPDDRTALERICKMVSERLGAGTVAIVTADARALAVEGRLWREMSSGVRDVVTRGTRVLPDRCREPLEAAEPVRYGGEVVAAFACRWTAGTAVDRDGAAMVLRAAALSAAAPVRALLDAAVPVAAQHACRDLIGESAAATALREAVVRAARAPFPVLIEGESGSGKELVARGIHRLGSRRDRRFCALNCAALSDELVEAELFGHARGAFTGAATERAGLFEDADGGTLFLDEIGELSARAQAKLLRVLQEGEVRRVGENMPRRVDVRVVAATNRRLEEEVSAGRFRADLRFRLDVVRITVPALRERAEDIPLLANHFWREASGRVGSQATMGPEALAALARYDWPGNVRELQNVMAWIAVHSPHRGRVGVSAIPAHVARAAAPMPCTFEAARAEFERRFIRAALAGANGRPSRAAAALGVSRQGLAKMMRRLQIEAP